jgi:pimeloyl-ACP methyl ester carboxylesterase
MQVVVNDLLTNYQLQGKGKLIVFLHGWGDSSAGSLALRQELAKHYTVLAPDLPGFGKTQAPQIGWDLDDYASFVQSLLVKLEQKDVYAVIGHSNGGAIAIRAMATGKLNPQKLILMAAAGIRSGQTFRRVLLQILAKTGNVATIGMPERYRSALRRQLYKSAGSDLLVVEGMQDTFKRTVRQDVQADAKTITQPTLLLFAEKDEAVPVYMAHRYEELLTNSQLHIVPGAGHFVHLDAPKETIKTIEEFLA